MSVAQQAKRKRRQHQIEFRDLSPLRRPRYSKPDAVKAARRERQKVEKLRLMQSRKSTKGGGK